MAASAVANTISEGELAGGNAIGKGFDVVFAPAQVTQQQLAVEDGARFGILRDAPNLARRSRANPTSDGTMSSNSLCMGITSSSGMMKPAGAQAPISS